MCLSPAGKLTSRALIRSICASLPGTAPDAAKRMWSVAMGIIRQTLLEGNSVVLDEICTLEPYVKAATRGYNPFHGRVEDIPECHFVRLHLSVGLTSELKKRPVDDDTASLEK